MPLGRALRSHSQWKTRAQKPNRTQSESESESQHPLVRGCPSWATHCPRALGFSAETGQWEGRAEKGRDSGSGAMSKNTNKASALILVNHQTTIIPENEPWVSDSPAFPISQPANPLIIQLVANSGGCSHNPHRSFSAACSGIGPGSAIWVRVRFNNQNAAGQISQQCINFTRLQKV